LGATTFLAGRVCTLQERRVEGNGKLEVTLNNSQSAGNGRPRTEGRLPCGTPFGMLVVSGCLERLWLLDCLEWALWPPMLRRAIFAGDMNMLGDTIGRWCADTAMGMRGLDSA